MLQYLLEHSKHLVPTATKPHLGCKKSLSLELFYKNTAQMFLATLTIVQTCNILVMCAHECTDKSCLKKNACQQQTSKESRT